MQLPIICQAILDHYLEKFPQAVYESGALLFAAQGVVAFFAGDSMVIINVKGSYNQETLGNLIKSMCLPTLTTISKVNKRRALLYLQKYGKTTNVEYCNPRVFDVLDEALGVRAVPVP